MIIKSASFIASNTDINKCPKNNLPEFAFIGRSNVGKSSLINMITANNKLAKVSTTPGKTQTINHFLINNKWYLVDLPGYGFAKRSKQTRTRFEQMIMNFIIQRKQLVSLFVLIDIRIIPQPIDLEFFKWLGSNNIPFVIVFTKSDKLNTNQLHKNLSRYLNQLSASWEPLPEYFVTSSKKQLGRDDLLNYIEKWLSVNEK